MLSGDAEPADRLADLLQLECSSRVLHVPCGDGGPAARLAWRLGCRVVGVDPSEGNVETAARRARELGVDSLCTFVRGDVAGADLGDGLFDAVICDLPLGGLPDPLETARELAGLLRPGGRLGFAAPPGADAAHTEDVAASLRSVGLESTDTGDGDAVIVAKKR
jgi:SAM-dependent methyltransferase